MLNVNDFDEKVKELEKVDNKELDDENLTLYEFKNLLQKKQERHVHKRNRFMFVDLKSKM